MNKPRLRVLASLGVAVFFFCLANQPIRGDRDPDRRGALFLARSGAETEKEHEGVPSVSSGQGFSASAQGEIIGVPWTGEQGITETVDKIMQRERETSYVFTGARVKRREFDRERFPKKDNPLAPHIARYPPSVESNLQVTPESPQTIGLTIAGPDLASSGYIPPDVMGDVGPTQILMHSNGRIRVYDKVTGILGALDATDNTFWNSVRNANDVSDPHVRYDRLSGRWFIVIINIQTAPNRVLVAMSGSSTITGTGSFTFFQFTHDAVGTTPNTDTGGFADYPTLGVDANALYVGMNIFNAAGTAIVGTTAYVINKANLLTSSLTVTAFRQIGAASGTGAGPWTPQGVDNDDPAATEGYFVGVDNASFSLLNIRRVSAPGGTPTLSGNLNVTVPVTRFPILQPHLGQASASRRLDALDDRLFAAMMRQNKITGTRTLWTAHNIQVNASGVGSSSGGRNGSRWYEIGSMTTTPTLVQSGTLFDTATTNPSGYWIPCVAMNGQGHVALGASSAGLARRAEIFVAGRLRTDALGTTQAPTQAQASATSYNVEATDGQRWGDYSQTVIDPTDDQTMWTFQEYCDAANSWRVRAIQLLAPAPAQPVTASPAALPAGSSDVNITVTGTSSSGSGFFDPGTGFTKRIAAQVNGGGVTVNSVTFTDPTHLTINISVTAGAAQTARTITITNPDGQSSTSATGILTISALPVQLASFNARLVRQSTVRLDWTTLSEINNYGFEIQLSSSVDGEYATIPNSFVPGHGTTLDPQQYVFEHASAQQFYPYYRLKQIDLDGSVDFSEPVIVQGLTSATELHTPVEFNLGQSYPNPFNPTSTIEYSLPVTSDVRLDVFDPTGRFVASLVNGWQQRGVHKVTVDGQALASGVYLYRLIAGSHVQTRKFILLK